MHNSNDDDFDKLENIEELDEFQSLISEVKDSIYYYLSENQDTISFLKKEMSKLDKSIFNNFIKANNGNEHKIMLELARALKTRAYDDNDFHEYVKWDTCCSHISMIITLNDIDLNNSIFREHAELFAKIFNLGHIHGHIIHKQIDSLFDDLYEDYFHRKKSSEIVKEGRWQENINLYNYAVNYAEKRWKEGDKLMHHEMAREIHSKEMFNSLSLNSLRKKLKDISRKYNRFFNLNEKKKQ